MLEEGKGGDGRERGEDKRGSKMELKRRSEMEKRGEESKTKKQHKMQKGR